MRQATVVAEQSLSVHAEIGGETVLGYLMRDDRVTVIGGPVKRRRQWWQIKTEHHSPNITGWVADGDGTHKWLAVDPVEPVASLVPWWWVGLAVIGLAVAAWLVM